MIEATLKTRLAVQAHHEQQLFIGGTTEWKLSANVDWLIAEAQDGGKWVHVGRVNSARRIRHFHEVGVDSIDGRSFSAWPDLYFAKFLKWMDRLNSQPVLGKFGRAYPGSEDEGGKEME